MRPIRKRISGGFGTVSTDAQFMLCSELLVAPVVKKGATNKNVYLPEGILIDYNDSARNIAVNSGLRQMLP